MGSNQFQKDYIEYLQEQNAELLNRLNHLKGSYENKILSKDTNKHYLISALEEVLHICTVMPQEIDVLFGKITEALSSFQGLLLRKSEMLLLVEKITKALNPEKFSNDLIAMGNSDIVNEHMSASRASKKVGMVKVSPMINGHVISTEPKVHLSRVPGYQAARRNGNYQLSPIIEASPDTSPDTSDLRSNIFREIKIPLERINLNKFSNESPKIRFKGPKTWKKSLSSYERHANSQRKSLSLENNENLKKKLSVGENDLSQAPDNDPLEGPSWLYEGNSEGNSSFGSFVDYRRRKRRFAGVFDKMPEDCLIYIGERRKEDGKEVYEDHDKTDDEKISGSSEDFICDSFTSDDNNSSFKRKSLPSKRRHSKGATKNDSTESEDNSRNEFPSFLDFKTDKKHSYSDSSDEGDDKENSVQRLAKGRKLSKKLSLNSSVGDMSKEVSFEKVPISSGSGEPLERRTSKRRTDINKENATRKVATERYVFVKLSDCLSTEEGFSDRSITRSANEGKKLKKNRKRSTSAAKLMEKNGREKRKAAPTFKLVEPALNTYVSKLRRN